MLLVNMSTNKEQETRNLPCSDDFCGYSSESSWYIKHKYYHDHSPWKIKNGIHVYWNIVTYILLPKKNY